MPLVPLLSGPVGVLLTWVIKKLLPVDHKVTDIYKGAQPAVAYIIAAALVVLHRPELCSNQPILTCATAITAAPLSTIAAIVVKELGAKFLGGQS